MLHCLLSWSHCVALYLILVCFGSRSFRHILILIFMFCFHFIFTSRFYSFYARRSRIYFNCLEVTSPVTVISLKCCWPCHCGRKERNHIKVRQQNGKTSHGFIVYQTESTSLKVQFSSTMLLHFLKVTVYGNKIFR